MKMRNIQEIYCGRKTVLKKIVMNSLCFTEENDNTDHKIVLLIRPTLEFLYEEFL